MLMSRLFAATFILKDAGGSHDSLFAARTFAVDQQIPKKNNCAQIRIIRGSFH